MQKVSFEKLSKQLQNGNKEEFKLLYLQLRPQFIRFSKRMGCTKEEIEEAYNDTFVSLYENIVHRKIESLKSSLKTYVFGIGKHMLLAKIKSRDNQSLSRQQSVEYKDFVYNIPNDNSPLIEMIKWGVSSMGAQCQEILHLYYYQRYSIDAICHHLKYKNSNTVKAQKSRCMKKLREIITLKIENGNH
ncbi:RNA polymerase sigma factor [Membranihabitans marinus]|uniref:RNA polymerase sigma factor n=1 Tax=Membranihabitans marinus TaxID=1227546 RepID=UPI001F159097|nr:sigma-70 family RNA polymerase sigma factor [Membranihabitans marinus]